MENCWALIELAIANGGQFRLFHRGKSMMPLLREGVDSVILAAPLDVKKNDIVMYKRADGQLVLHRIVKLNGESCVMCGDNHSELEYGITLKDVLAKVIGIYREDVYVDVSSDKKYKRYVKKLPFIRFKKRFIDIPIDHMRHPEKRKNKK